MASWWRFSGAMVAAWGRHGGVVVASWWRHGGVMVALVYAFKPVQSSRMHQVFLLSVQLISFELYLDRKIVV